MMRSVYVKVADSGDRPGFGLEGFSKLFPLCCLFVLCFLFVCFCFSFPSPSFAEEGSNALKNKPAASAGGGSVEAEAALPGTAPSAHRPPC